MNIKGPHSRRHSSTSDYLNLIKVNKLRLLENRSRSNPKVVHKDMSQRDKVNPENQRLSQEEPTRSPFVQHSTVTQYQGKYYLEQHPRDVIRQIAVNRDYSAGTKLYLEGPVEKKVKMAKLVYGGSQLQLGSDKRTKNITTSVIKHKNKKSIIALVSIDEGTGETRFPTIKRLPIPKMKAQQTSGEIDCFEKGVPPRFTPCPTLDNQNRSINKQEHQQIIQTFYDYERLLKQKEMLVSGSVIPKMTIPKEESPSSNSIDRKRLKTCFLQSRDQLVYINQKGKKEIESINSTVILERSLGRTAVMSLLKPKSHTNTPNTQSQEMILPHRLNKRRIFEGGEETVYEAKVKAYREFVFVIHFAHSRFDSIVIPSEPVLPELRYKAFVGRGNNCLLLKGLLRKRYWWVFEEDVTKCQFVWTQLKNASYLKLQHSVSKEDNLRLVSEKNMKATKKKPLLFSECFNKKGRNRPSMKEGVEKILDEVDTKVLQKYKALDLEEHKTDIFEYRLKYLNKKLIPCGNKAQSRMHNHIQHNQHIGNKKALFYNMREFCRLTNRDVFRYLPLTYHIKEGTKGKEYLQFVKEFKQRAIGQRVSKDGPINTWIVKPGEVSNRGNGITVVNTIQDIHKLITQKEKHSNGTHKTYILQSYLDKPLLYNGRKFDIRHYMLITSLYGQIKAYWYSDGYVRTSAEEFDISDVSDPMIHLTNDAIQKKGVSYGEYEPGNKLSYNDLQRYIQSSFPEKKINFYEHIYPKMKEIGTHAIASTFLKINPSRLQHGFEVLGLDFMIDQELNVWMIEVNTNPCLEVSCPLLGRIIPNMVEQVLRLTVDVVYPPLSHYPNSKKHLFPDYSLQHLKFELVFDEQRDGPVLEELYKDSMEVDCGQIDDDDETFENEGNDLCEGQLDQLE